MQAPVLDIVNKGDIGGETVAMRIDANSIDFLMKILSDLYSDPQEAVIREYSVNARDSHVEAGQTRPIEITTPTRLAPYFKVQDYGVGLSVDDMRNIYSAYGASTKRQTNEQAGMLGLGSKSGLTISGQFTVVAIKDGIMTHVVVNRTETGGANMQIVESNPTDKPTGVLISIPVGHNIVGFDAKVANFFKYWEPGTVLVNGVRPEHLVAEELAPGIRIVDNKVRNTAWHGTVEYETKPDVVVMGGIAYPIDDDYTPGFRTEFHVIFDVPIGSINFTPSREQLHYTKQTKETLAECYEKYDKAMSGKVTEALADAETIKGALTVAHKWATRLGHSKVPAGWQYKGKDIPKEIGPYDVIFAGSGYTEFKSKSIDIYDIYAVDKTNGRHSYSKPCHFVTDFPMDELSAYGKGRINKFKESLGYGKEIVVTKDNKIAGDFWASEVPKSTWKELLAATREERTKSENIFKGEDEFHILEKRDPTRDYWSFNIKAAPAGKTIYYFEPKDYSKLPESTVARLAEELDAVVVKVYARRLEDFNKLHTNAKHLRTIKDDLQTLYNNKVSEADKFHNTATKKNIDIAWLPKDRIDDPELIKLIGLANTPRESKRWFNQIQRDLSDAQLGYLKDEGNSTINVSHLEIYPLLNSFSSGRARSNALYMDDVCDYLNTTYKKRK